MQEPQVVALPQQVVHRPLHRLLRSLHQCLGSSAVWRGLKCGKGKEKVPVEAAVGACSLQQLGFSRSVPAVPGPWWLTSLLSTATIMVRLLRSASAIGAANFAAS